MPPLAVIGKSLLMACCGSLFYFGDTDSNSNVTEAYNITENIDALMLGVENNTKYPSWIAPSKMTDIPILNGSKSDIGAEIHITIKIPGKADSVQENAIEANIIMVNKTFPKGSNIIQINIFNNGAPISYPTIIKTQNMSDGVSYILVSTGETSSSDITLTLPSSVPLSVLYTPPEETIDPLPWWKTSIIYQIYPRSFKDTTSTGTGDLRGITSKADYLKELGVGTVWVSPFYVSPMADFGYDVQDFRKVDPLFGATEDFDVMLKELHKRDIKVIMDFIPNHSSDQHEWFQKSVKRVDPYTDYYVWQKPKGFNETGDPLPPNNWLSVFGGSAWEWAEEREEFYLHQFLKEQPDLNVRNPLVMEELDGILVFWLERGVDGFRMDALKFLFETKDLHLDEPPSIVSNATDPNEYEYLSHEYSVNQPETVHAIKRWRQIFEEYPDRLMVAEVYDDDLEEIMKYYGSSSTLLSHFPFNFHLITELQKRSDVTGIKLRELVDIWFGGMPHQDNWPNWVLGNHDRKRVSSRLGKDLVDALNMFLLLLPGTPTTYYGEEIGMEDTLVTYEEAQDPFGLDFGPERYFEFGRDPQRTPMQWDDTINAGFSEANSTWLPVNPNYKTINVKSQENAEQSSLKVYRQVAKLRNEETFRRGNFSFPVVKENVIALKRFLEGEPPYLLIINTSPNEIELGENTEGMLRRGIVMVRSSFDTRQDTSVGSQVDLNSLSLLAGEGLVVKLNEE